MSRFLVDRGIFEKSFWADVPAFRLFFFLMGKAAWKDGVKVGPIELKRGQLIRSYRKLQDDLIYIENCTEKLYSTKTIKRCVDDLVQQGRLKVEECSFGTLFTLVNYEQYQGFSEATTGNVETLRKQRGNTEETIRTKTKQVNKTTPPAPQGGECRFEEFWNIYPNRKNKAKARSIWERDRLDRLADQIIAAVKRYATSPNWLKESGQFIPHPTTFLNGKRWEDEVSPVVGQTAHQTRAQAMLEAWKAGKRFKLKASGAIVKASDVEPFNHEWQKVTEDKPTAFRSRRTGNHAFFTEFEILEE